MMDKVESLVAVITGRMKDKQTDKSWSRAEWRRLLAKVRDWCEKQLGN